MANYLNLEWNEKVHIDESIESYEYRRFPPNAGGRVALNQQGEIHFTIESTTDFVHPHNSYIEIKGKLTKDDGTNYDNSDLIAFVNNAMMYLFSTISYTMGGQQIESLIHPGQGTTMLGLLEYSEDFSVSNGLNLCWFKDNNYYKDDGGTEKGAIMANRGFKARHDMLFSSSANVGRGCFSFIIPLSHIFGFCKDYDKIIYGVKHELTFNRKIDNESIFIGVGAADPKIELTNIYWYVPIVKPALENLNFLLKAMENNIEVQMPFNKRQFFQANIPQNSRTFSWALASKSASEKPRILVLGFQVGNKKDKGQNPSVFDHVNIEQIHVFLNNTRRYPALDFEMDFNLNDINNAFNMCSRYKSILDGIPSCISSGNINPIDFKTLFPLFVIDLSKQPADLRSSLINITVEMKFGVNTLVNTFVYGALISDKVFTLKADGKELKPVF